MSIQLSSFMRFIGVFEVDESKYHFSKLDEDLSEKF